MKQAGHIFRICSSTLILAASAAASRTTSDTHDLLEQSRALRRRFMIQKASAVDATTPHREAVSLTELIEEVMSLRTPTQAGSNNAASSKPAANRSTEQQTAKLGTTAAETAVNASARKANDDTTHRTAVEILRTPDKQRSILYPMEAADVLYRAGKPDEAARYYEMALSAVDEDDVAVRQWLLYQTANSLRHIDAPRSAAYYEELIRLYPNSIWTPAAQARHRIIIWLETRREELQARIAEQDNDEQ